MDDHDYMAWIAIGALVVFMLVAGVAHADNVTQPGVLATSAEHSIFTQNLIFAVAAWFAFIFGAICGFSLARKRNSGGGAA